MQKPWGKWAFEGLASAVWELEKISLGQDGTIWHAQSGLLHFSLPIHTVPSSLRQSFPAFISATPRLWRHPPRKTGWRFIPAVVQAPFFRWGLHQRVWARTCKIIPESQRFWYNLVALLGTVTVQVYWEIAIHLLKKLLPIFLLHKQRCWYLTPQEFLLSSRFRMSSGRRGCGSALYMIYSHTFSMYLVSCEKRSQCGVQNSLRPSTATPVTPTSAKNIPLGDCKCSVIWETLMRMLSSND